MRALARRLRPQGHDDRGVALLVVIGIGMLMLMLVATGLTIALSGLKKTDTDQDWNGAMDAAYAGVEEYQSRLAGDSSYYLYGNPAAAFSKAPLSSSNVKLPPVSNPAFGVTASDSWAMVPDSSPVASFRYEVDNSHYAENGRIRIRSTGRVGNVTRSIVADLKQDGFIDYLWFVDYEVQDPQFTNKAYCKAYAWEGRDSSCEAIEYGTADIYEGPARSNDTMRVCYTQFKGTVTSANPNNPLVVTPSGCSSGRFAVAPTRSDVIEMPVTNAEMRKETRNDLPAEVAFPGCLYTGPTVITFTSDGKMNVKSPWTKATNITANLKIGSSPSQCGVPGTAAKALGSPEGATINVLPANLIYVQDVPADTTDVNARTGVPLGFTCVGGTNPGWTFGTARFPTTNEQLPQYASTGNPAYGCRNGDAFVQGVFKGAMTIAAENYLYVTGNLTYADEAADMLGLVGNGAVWVWNPMNANTPILPKDRTIEAAILSVQHTFQVQNFDVSQASRGTLTVFGSIAQTFRGTVSRGSAGYIKDYRYDERFRYMAPPKFLSPVSSTYGVTQFAGVAAAFSATGAPQ